MLPLYVIRDGREYAQLFTMRNQRNNTCQKIHHEQRKSAPTRMSITDDLLSQVRVQPLHEKHTLRKYPDIDYIGNIPTTAVSAPIERAFHWLHSFPEESPVGLLPQWKLGDLDFRGCVDWLLDREDLCFNQEGSYAPHVISADLQRKANDLLDGLADIRGVDVNRRNLEGCNDTISELISGTLAGVAASHRSWSAQELSLEWRMADFESHTHTSRLQSMVDCLPVVSAPMEAPGLNIIRAGYDLVGDWLAQESGKTVRIRNTEDLHWTQLLPETAGAYAQNSCRDTGLLMPDLASSHSSLTGAARPCAILSAAALLERYGSKTASPVQREVVGIWTSNAAALERLVDLQSPWQLLPVRRRASAPASRLLISRAVADSLLPYLDARCGRKRRLSALMFQSPAYPLVDLSELKADEDGRSAKRRRGDAQRAPSADMASFVEVATAECVHVPPRNQEPVKQHDTGRAEPMGAAKVQHGKPPHPPQEAPPEAAAACAPQTRDATLVGSTKNRHHAVPPSNLPAVARQPASAGEPAPARLSPSPPSVDFSLPGFSTEGLMEQYMRLQRGENASTGPLTSSGRPQAHQVTPQRRNPPPRPVPESSSPAVAGTTGPSAQVSPQVSSSASSRIAQLAAHNGAHFLDAGVRLDVLVSERFLEQHAHASGEIASAHGINLVDCPLEEPLSFILDATTAVSILPVDVLTDRAKLKVLVKQLTNITFKFSKIYLVLTVHSGAQSNTAQLQLCQTLMRFPAQVMLRQCSASPTAVGQVVNQLCKLCVRDSAAGADATTAKYLHRPFIEHVLRAEGNILSHCEFLQRFPTVNFYLACALLHHFPLRSLLRQTPAAVCSQLRAQHVCAGETEGMVASFLQLVSTHAGLGACV